MLSSGNGQRDSRETATETCTNAACPGNENSPVINIRCQDKEKSSLCPKYPRHSSFKCLYLYIFCFFSFLVNGNWGGWGISQSCNVTCGNGHQQMTRQCNSPAPSNGGQFCKLTSSPQLASTETILQTCSRGACAGKSLRNTFNLTYRIKKIVGLFFRPTNFFFGQNFHLAWRIETLWLFKRGEITLCEVVRDFL